MSEKTPVCSRCGKECEEQTHGNPTWFGSYQNEKLVEVICIDCWEKGEKWEKK